MRRPSLASSTGLQAARSTKANNSAIRRAPSNACKPERFVSPMGNFPRALVKVTNPTMRLQSLDLIGGKAASVPQPAVPFHIPHRTHSGNDG
jgi:hypothetical protein